MHYCPFHEGCVIFRLQCNSNTNNEINSKINQMIAYNVVISTPHTATEITTKVLVSSSRVIRKELMILADNAEKSAATCIGLMQWTKNGNIFSPLFEIKKNILTTDQQGVIQENDDNAEKAWEKRITLIYPQRTNELLSLTYIILCMFRKHLSDHKAIVEVNQGCRFQEICDHSLCNRIEHTKDEISKRQKNRTESGVVKLNPSKEQRYKKKVLRWSNTSNVLTGKLENICEQIFNAINASKKCMKLTQLMTTEHVFAPKLEMECMYHEEILYQTANTEIDDCFLFEANNILIYHSKTNRYDGINIIIRLITEYTSNSRKIKTTKMVFIEGSIIIETRVGKHAHFVVMMLVENADTSVGTCLQLIKSRKAWNICSSKFDIIGMYPTINSDQELKFETNHGCLFQRTDDPLVLFNIKHTDNKINNKPEYEVVTPITYLKAILSKIIRTEVLMESIEETQFQTEKKFGRCIKLNQSGMTEDLLDTAFEDLSTDMEKISYKPKSPRHNILPFRKTEIPFDIHEITSTKEDKHYKSKQIPECVLQATHSINNEKRINKEITRQMTNIEEYTFSTKTKPIVKSLPTSDPMFGVAITIKTTYEITTAQYNDMTFARGQQVQKIRIKSHDDGNEKHPQLVLPGKKISRRFRNLALLLPSKVTTLPKCFIMICLLVVVSCKDITVTWNMKSHMIYFGKTAKLECVISDKNNSCDRTLRQWYGGKPYGFLCRNGACRNEEKYLEQEVSLCKYTLNIHNFSESDVNCEYTCSYGVYRNRKMLKLDNDHFVYAPSMTHVYNTVQENDMLNGSVFIPKAFPKPSCVTSFAGKNIHTDTDFKSTGYLYETRIRIEYKPPHNMCKGIFNISCMIGSLLFTPVYQNVTLCNADNNRQNEGLHYGLYVAVITGILIITILMVVVAYKRRGWRMQCHDYMKALNIIRIDQ